MTEVIFLPVRQIYLSFAICALMMAAAYFSARTLLLWAIEGCSAGCASLKARLKASAAMAITVYLIGLMFFAEISYLGEHDIVLPIIWISGFGPYMACEYAGVRLWSKRLARKRPEGFLDLVVLLFFGSLIVFILLMIFVGLSVFPWQESIAAMVIMASLFAVFSSVVMLLMSSYIGACRKSGA